MTATECSLVAAKRYAHQAALGMYILRVKSGVHVRQNRKFFSCSWVTPFNSAACAAVVEMSKASLSLMHVQHLLKRHAGFANVTPIMLSLVTSCCSCSSVQLSVPLGL